MAALAGLALTVLATVAGVASVAALLPSGKIEPDSGLDRAGVPQTLTNIQSVLRALGEPVSGAGPAPSWQSIIGSGVGFLRYRRSGVGLL